jgi:hypothetical protein
MIAAKEFEKESDKREVDLPPHQWESDRAKPYEPFWGPGWPEALAYITGVMIVATAVYLFR